jgi:thiol-disulfide isomerase/thioredoxin
MTSISVSAFLFSNGSSSSRRIDNIRNPNSVFNKVQESTKLQVVDSPSLFSEAQEEERTRKQKLENIKSKIKEKTRLIYKNNHKKKMVVKPLLVDNIQDYKSIVVDETEQLVVVFFHAPWCKSCRVTKPLFQKVCQEYFHQVKFVHVPLTKTTAYLQQGLGMYALHTDIILNVTLSHWILESWFLLALFFL